MSYQPTGEILALIDYDSIHEATAEIARANRAFDAVAGQARAAEASLNEARAALPALLRTAVEEGAQISDEQIVAAYRRAKEAEQIVDIRREIARRLAPSQVEADARLSAARARAYAAVLEHGIDLQISAAERGDKAAGTPDRNPDLAERAAAKAEFEAASRIVLYAIQRGARPVHQPTWPVTAHQLRRIWGREEVTEIAA